ncbi:hypothetical protein MMC21_001738 [Puttea exsequens]|nr:hypothetical protein [Puttea exsequens]
MSLHHLIIVCCHAVWLGGPNAGEDESEWAIESFQKGETLTFIKHIKAGIQKLEELPDSLLVFSGGATKPYRTSLSEGTSYLTLAHALTAASPYLHARMASEPHATDSYQNVLFSLLLFYRRAQAYPTALTIVSHDFKHKRFVEVHLRALRWPVGRGLRFLGVDPPE